MRKRVSTPKPESYEIVFCKPPDFSGPQHPALAQFTLTRDAALALGELMRCNQLPANQHQTHVIRTKSGHRILITRMT